MTEQVESVQIREAFQGRYRIGDLLEVKWRSNIHFEHGKNVTDTGFLINFDSVGIYLAGQHPHDPSILVGAAVKHNFFGDYRKPASQMQIPYGSIMSCRKMVPDESSGIELKVSRGDGK